MNNPGKRLRKLVELARRGRPETEPAGSPAFTARVIAQWSADRGGAPDWLGELIRLGRVGLAFALVVLLASVVFHHPTPSGAGDLLAAFAGIEPSAMSGL